MWPSNMPYRWNCLPARMGHGQGWFEGSGRISTGTRTMPHFGNLWTSGDAKVRFGRWVTNPTNRHICDTFRQKLMSWKHGLRDRSRISAISDTTVHDDTTAGQSNLSQNVQGARFSLCVVTPPYKTKRASITWDGETLYGSEPTTELRLCSQNLDVGGSETGQSSVITTGPGRFPWDEVRGTGPEHLNRPSAVQS